MNHGTRASKGCNEGNKCKDFHPKMCPMSITKSECFDLSCTLCHVKGTRRKRLPEKSAKTRSDGAKTPVWDETRSGQSAPNSAADKESSTITDFSKVSFLDQINLLKKELQEAVDKKLETLIQMQMQSPLMHQQKLPFIQIPTQQTYAPVPWMPQMYPMQRNPLYPMGC